MEILQNQDPGRDLPRSFDETPEGREIVSADGFGSKLTERGVALPESQDVSEMSPIQRRQPQAQTLPIQDRDRRFGLRAFGQTDHRASE